MLPFAWMVRNSPTHTVVASYLQSDSTTVKRFTWPLTTLKQQTKQDFSFITEPLVRKVSDVCDILMVMADTERKIDKVVV